MGKSSKTSLEKQYLCLEVGCWEDVHVVVRGCVSNWVVLALRSLWYLFHLPVGRCPQLKRRNGQPEQYLHPERLT